MTDLSARGALSRAVEQRAVPFRDLEVRSPNQLDPDLPGMQPGDLLFTGYACVTGEPYPVEDFYGEYTEIVRAGAFAKCLAEGADVPFKLNHGGISLARTKSGTMWLQEDSVGLRTKAALDPNNPEVQVIRSAMNRGDVDEMSFAFWVTRQEWSPDFTQRDIIEVTVNKGDVSVVNYGQNPATSGAKLRNRDIDRMPTNERRELYERLAAEFNPKPPAVHPLGDLTARLSA